MKYIARLLGLAAEWVIFAIAVWALFGLAGTWITNHMPGKSLFLWGQWFVLLVAVIMLLLRAGFSIVLLVSLVLEVGGGVAALFWSAAGWFCRSVTWLGDHWSNPLFLTVAAAIIIVDAFSGRETIVLKVAHQTSSKYAQN